jgi:molybdenum cofactor cytidylyltransferase
MGEPKQLLSLQGKPMLRMVTETVCAAELAQVVVVVGAHAESVRQAVSGLDVNLVVNVAWREGMSTSLKAGLRVLNAEIQATLLILADQPALTPNLLQALVARYRTTGAHIVAPFYEGRRGNPVLFDRTLFPELSAIEGDQGGRSVVARHQNDVEQVEIEDPSPFMDVDTRKDYAAMQALSADR